jgi:hypothetical protein
MKYYSLENILKRNCIYNVIFGERSNGKTYAILQYGLKQYFKNGSQIGIIRRWKEDIIGRRASDIWSALNENGEVEKLSKGDYKGVTYYAGKFFVCNYDENGKAVYNDDDCIGYTFSLSDTEHNKSISYPKIRTIFFDEFLTKKLYLADEFILFMNTISTIIRNRTNVKIFMAGNTVNRYCPYFKEMGLKHISRMKQGDIDVYTYGESGKLTVAVEYCSSSYKSKKNNAYFAFDNPKLKMITSGAWELDIYPHLPFKYKSRDILYTFFIVFEGTFQCEIINADTGIFIYIHRKTTELKLKQEDIIYTLDTHYSMNYNSNIMKPMNTVQRKIAILFNAKKVFYQDNEVGNTIENYLRICKRG